MRRVSELHVAREAEQPHCPTAALALELVDVPIDDAAPAGTLERGISRQLDHVWATREPCAERAAPEHARRVDDVRARGPPRDLEAGAHVNGSLRQRAANPANRIHLGRRVGARGDHDLDAVTARA